MPRSLARGLRNSMIQLPLSPETPLARDACLATRSVTHATATHHLATGLHEAKEYFPLRSPVKGKLSTKIRCTAFKKVINEKRQLLALRTFPARRNQGGGLDGIELWKILVEIRLAQLGDFVLLRAGALGVLVVQHFDHVHPFAIDNPKGREALPVQAGVVLQIDEDLRRPRIGQARLCVRQVAALVGLYDRLVLNIGLVPRCRNWRIGVDPELHHEAGYHAEKAAVVIKVVLHQVVEAVRADGSPRTVHRHCEITTRSRELHVKLLRSRVFEQRGAKQCAVKALARRFRWSVRRCLRQCRRRRRGWCLRFWRGGSLRFGLFRRLRFGGLLFRLASEKQRSHHHGGDKPLYLLHFPNAPYACD